ncbi:MAG TPA: BatD family protein [Verrucomicrobiae bacterium]|nr:BatD family protein [Verrucomicrobiae bacterium]
MAKFWPGRNPRVSPAPAGAWLLLLSTLMLFTLVASAEAVFTASLDRQNVVLGDSVALTLQFRGVSPSSMPALPPIPGLQQSGSVESSMNTTIGPDGNVTSVSSFTITLVPTITGEITIPALTVQVGGQRLTSAPLKLTVSRAAPSAAQNQNSGKLAFLSLSIPGTNFYVGQIIPVELDLFIRGDVRNISDVQIPPLRGDGFTSGKFVQGQRFSRQVGNTQFIVFPISTFISPVKAGELTLNALNASVVVHLPSQRPRQIDPFFQDFFGSMTEPKQVPLLLEQRTIEVIPLPSDHVPAGFNGAVGQYAMTFNAGPTNVQSGDPITVKLQITGRGNLDALTLPDQPAWQDFKVYPPKMDNKAQDQLGIQGTKDFEEIVVPQSSDIKELPGFVFSFFDPQRREYRTLSEPGIKLNVAPAASSAAPTVAAAASTSAAQAPPQATDIVPIKERPGAITGTAAPLVQEPWFLAIQGVPLAAFLGALVWRRRTDSLANNPRLRRKRAVVKILDEGIGQLRALAAEGKAEEFFGTLFRLLQEKLGQVLDVPASAITEAVVDDALRPRGFPEETLAGARDLFHACNLARYAPARSSQELAAFVPRLEATIQALDSFE